MSTSVQQQQSAQKRRYLDPYVQIGRDKCVSPWYNISTFRRYNTEQQPKTINGDYSMAAAATIEGTVNFSNVTKHDVFNGQDTGAYSMTITMSEDDASTLSAQGVKIKDYQGAKQRKFKSKYEIKRFDADGNRYDGEVPYNSKVRLKYVLGQPHPVHGVATYLEAVKVLEEAEMSEGDSGDF